MFLSSFTQFVRSTEGWSADLSALRAGVPHDVAHTKSA